MAFKLRKVRLLCTHHTTHCMQFGRSVHSLYIFKVLALKLLYLGKLIWHFGRIYISYRPSYHANVNQLNEGVHKNAGYMDYILQ